MKRKTFPGVGKVDPVTHNPHMDFYFSISRLRVLDLTRKEPCIILRTIFPKLYQREHFVGNIYCENISILGSLDNAENAK